MTACMAAPAGVRPLAMAADRLLYQLPQMGKMLGPRIERDALLEITRSCLKVVRPGRENNDIRPMRPPTRRPRLNEFWIDNEMISVDTILRVMLVVEVIASL